MMTLVAFLSVQVRQHVKESTSGDCASQCVQPVLRTFYLCIKLIKLIDKKVKFTEMGREIPALVASDDSPDSKQVGQTTCHDTPDDRHSGQSAA